MRSALIPILLNSVPGLVRNAYPADVLPSLSLVAHYDQDLYWVRGRGQCSITDIQTCTRAQTVPSYATMASGLLVPFAANTNRRTDFGVLPEQAATNLALQSQFASSWGLTAVTLTNNAAQSRLGNVSATSLNEDGTTGAHFTSQAITKAASALSYTFSADIYPNNRTYVWVGLDDGTASNRSYVQFNLAGVGSITGAASSVGGFSGASASITKHGSAYNITLTTTTNTGTTVRVIIASDNNSGFASTAPSFAGANNSALYIDLAQLELGSVATSYIPTTTVPVARAADNIASTVPWLTTNIGFMFASVGGAAAIGGAIFNTHNSTETDPIYAKTSTTIATYINGDKAVATLGSGTISGAGKYAVGFDGSGHSLVGNNGTVATNVGTFNNTSTLIIGSVAGSSSFYNGPIKRIALGQARPSDAVLKALTQ